MVGVSNEVGMGVHPDTPLGRRYRDVLGRVNQRWAATADVALLMVAGRAVRLSDPFSHVGNAVDDQVGGDVVASTNAGPATTPPDAAATRLTPR